MPGANVVLDKGFVPTAAVGQWKCVILATTANERVTEAGLGAAVFGVCQEDVSAADAVNLKVANIRILGISNCVASAAITRGARVAAAADGKVVTAAPAVGVNANIVGIALESTTADGDHVHVLLTPGASLQG